MTLSELLIADERMTEQDIKEFVEQIFGSDEEQVAAFGTKRNGYIVLTNSRFILAELKGMTGLKRTLMSIPLAKISAFSVETPGLWDTGGELRLWVSGIESPIKLEFLSGTNVCVIQKILAILTE